MINLILLLGLTGGQVSQPVAQYTPCSWPNKCEQVEVSSINTCQWPNLCTNPAPVANEITTCEFPKKCQNS